MKESDVEPQGLTDEARESLEEARMVLPGIQALMGFQLMAIFNERFEALSSLQQVLHLASLVLVTLAIALVMTPAAYHRIAEPGVLSRRFINLTSRLIATSMVPLALGLALDVFLVVWFAVGGWIPGALVGAGVLLVFAMFWFAFPLRRRRARQS
jgi:Family of unknown function (DUF6328)